MSHFVPSNCPLAKGWFHKEIQYRPPSGPMECLCTVGRNLQTGTMSIKEEKWFFIIFPRNYIQHVQCLQHLNQDLACDVAGLVPPHQCWDFFSPECTSWWACEILPWASITEEEGVSVFLTIRDDSKELLASCMPVAMHMNLRGRNQWPTKNNVQSNLQIIVEKHMLQLCQDLKKLLSYT